MDVTKCLTQACTIPKHFTHTLERVFKIYGTARFVVQTAMMDMEFEKLKTLMPHVTLNTTATQEQIGEIE